MSTTVIQASDKQVTGTDVAGKHGIDTNIIAGSVTGTFTTSGLTIAGKITKISIDDTTWYLAPVTPLALRNNIVVQNQSTNGGIMLWNYSAAAPATEGITVSPNASRSIAITGSIPVYVRMLSGTGIACIEELA